MKKLLSFLLLSVLITTICISVTSCDVVGTIKGWGEKAGENYEKYNAYDYALIAVPDGTTIKIDLSFWGISADGIVVKSTDGTYYFTSTENCTLVNEPDIDINIPYMKLDLDFKLYTTAIVKCADGTVLTLKPKLYYTPTEGYYCIHTEDEITYRIDKRNILFMK